MEIPKTCHDGQKMNWPHSGNGRRDVILLEIKGVGHIPSFKNRKRAIMDRSTGKMRTLTEPSVKKRMENLESAIVCELFSVSQTIENATPSECLKPLRTLLCGLSDDSIREIPCGSWDVKYVQPGEEGVTIEIEPYVDP